MGSSTKEEKVSNDSHSTRSRRREKSKEKESGSISTNRQEQSRKRERSRSHERDRSNSRDREGRSSKRRQRSRDREEGRRRERSRSRERRRSKERERDSRRHRDDSDHEGKSSKRQKEESNNSKQDGQGGTAVESLSIEETNKLRAQLGLTPLEVGESGSKDKEFVHVPAHNLGAIKETEKLKEKLAVIREKRMLAEKYKNVKNLGAVERDDDSMRAWVERSRKLNMEKEKAQKRAAMLAAMDDEFGIGNLVETEFGKASSHQQHKYQSTDLAGLKIEHEKDLIKEGQNVILTLQDKGILENDNEDILENVNIKDDEIAMKNIELKKRKPDYQPYDDDEWDEHGMPQTRRMLSKYDEVIDGDKKKYFRLNTTGAADMTIEKELQQMKEEHNARSTSLEYSKGKIGSEFYTPEELVQFKKPKKKRRKIRKPGTIKADDLIALEADDNTNDHGSRLENLPITSTDNDKIQSKNLTLTKNLEIDSPDNDSDDDINVSISDNSNLVLYDEAEVELENTLARSLKRKQVQERSATNREKIVETASELDDDAYNSGIIFNRTTEFCRSVGETSIDVVERTAQGRSVDKESSKDYDAMEVEIDNNGNDEKGSGWQTVETENEKGSSVVVDGSEVGFLNDEPILSKGTAAALLLATKKGYLDAPKKELRHKPLNLPATDYVIDERAYDIDDKFNAKAAKEMDRNRYGHSSFKDKEDYKPDFKLQYFDDSGRSLNPKEAFRELSHRFHGKRSGKKKSEKRIKKLAEEEALKKMNSTDTPLGTVSLMREKLEQTQNPFLVLSGGGKGLINTISIRKDK